MYAAIRSTGCYVPEIEVPNAELARRFEEREPGQVDKMEGTTGIRTRFHAPPAWATSDLAVRAARAGARARGRHAGRRRSDPGRHRLAGLHHAGDLGRRAAQARREARGHVRRRLRVRVVPDGAVRGERHHGARTRG